MSSIEKAYQTEGLGGPLANEPLRVRLVRRKAETQRYLEFLDEALKKLDDNPNIEETIEAISRAGF